MQPDTVVSLRRAGFRLYWRSISRPGPGRPLISPEVRHLIIRMATENQWRARRIQAELEKLDIRVSLATVSRYLPKREPDLSQRQSWKTFLWNHSTAIGAMDFFVVPTASFKLLYVWFVIGHERREILHENLTAHPTTAWDIQQLREAFPDETPIQHLIHDNDSIFSERVDQSIAAFGIEAEVSSPGSPWQYGTAERWVGTVKRDPLDRVIVLDEAHLRRLLREYVEYYNEERVHMALRDAPVGRLVRERPSVACRLVGQRRLGGLHHSYQWREVA
ncbi:MAG: transposase [Spirochaetaceae bacterium]|nr:transposase [Spirochaetaceae bacterium]